MERVEKTQRGHKGVRNGPKRPRRGPEGKSEIMTAASRGDSSNLSLWVDESEKGEILAVGGVLVKWDSTVAIVQQWREMKQSLGLEPDDEVKWSLPSEHPTRTRLKARGHTTRDLCEKTVECISSMDLYCVVALMFEQRQLARWKAFWSKASIRDFYCEGLKYVVQRAAEEVVETTATGCVVICDTPELGKRQFTQGSIRRGARAVEDAYKEWHRNGVGPGPGRLHHPGPLKEIGFHPSVLVADATHHDMLQLADVVVGLTSNWIAAVGSGKADPWLIERVKAVRARFRARHGSPQCWGDGLVLWPWQNELWEGLKRSLQ